MKGSRGTHIIDYAVDQFHPLFLRKGVIVVQRVGSLLLFCVISGTGLPDNGGCGRG